MRRKSQCNRRLFCEVLEPRAMLSGSGSFFANLPGRLESVPIAASVLGPATPKVAAAPSNPFAGVNVGIGLQAQAAASANSFLAGIPITAISPSSSMIGPPDPFATPRGLASPLQIGPAIPAANSVIPTTNTLSPLVNAVSGLTNTLNAFTGSNNTLSGLANPFNTASNTLLELTNTLNALDNATLFSDINGFLGGATAIVQVSPGVSAIATPLNEANSGILTSAAPFAQANSGVNATVAILLSAITQAQKAVNNAVAQSTGPIAPLVGQVLANSQALVNNFAPLESFNNS